MMRLKKYEHACLVLEKDGSALIIDPGDISDDFIVPERVDAIVITHNHPDHLDEKKIEAILDKNPNAIIVSLASIIEGHSWPNTKAVAAGDECMVGPFRLRFFGGKHALVHQSIPIVDNVGVLVNDVFYYPGDSYSVPEVPVKILALPTSGPWLKIGEAVDFALAVKPELAFSIHDAHSSEKNMQLLDFMLPKLLQPSGISYSRLTSPIEIED